MYWNQIFIEYFFTYSDDIPAGVGFSMFGFSHILWLLLLVLGIGYVYQKVVRSDRATASRIVRYIGDFMLFLIVLRILVICVIGAMSVYELPIHLCSLAGFLGFIHARRQADWIGQVLYTLCLPGTVFALVFPNWTEYPPINFITIQGFLFHGAIVLFMMCQLHLKNIVPNIKCIWKPIVFLLVSVPFMYVFNIRYRTNYFFVRVPSADSPLEWIAKYMGVPGYLWGYALLVICVMLCMYGGYMLVRKIAHRRANFE